MNLIKLGYHLYKYKFWLILINAYVLIVMLLCATFSSSLHYMAEIHQVCGDLAIIALSGRLEARQAALDAGVDAFVSKGDPPERLLAAISTCCSPEMALS